MLIDAVDVQDGRIDVRVQIRIAYLVEHNVRPLRQVGIEDIVPFSDPVVGRVWIAARDVSPASRLAHDGCLDFVSKRLVERRRIGGGERPSVEEVLLHLIRESQTKLFVIAQERVWL